MKFLRSAFSLSLLLLGSACSTLSFTAVNLPNHFDDVSVTRDIAYGPGPDQKMDIYLPADIANGQPHDVVVFFYGGRWTFGTKEQYAFVGNAFAKRGFVVVIPDYAKYPAVKFPVFVQDGAKALAWTADHIAEYHGDTARIHVAGHSAGAHIGALLTTDPAYLRAEGKDRSAVIHDFVGLAGPYSFVPDENDLKDMFGPPANYPQMQADTFIDGKQPPMLLLWGADDTLVGRINMEKMQGAVAVRGGCIATKIYPGTTHIGIGAALSWINPDGIPVLDDMTAYFNQRVPQGSCPAGPPASE